MKKTLLALVCLSGGLLLSACSSSSSEQTTQTEPTNNTVATPIEPTPVHEQLGLSQNQRYSITIQPTQVETAQLQAPPLSRDLLAKSITHEISSALNETHKFDIMVSSMFEQTIYDEDGIGHKEVREVQPAADYILTSTLSQLEATETLKIIKATGQGVEEKVVFIVINYKIIHAESSQAILTKTLRYQLKNTGNNESLRQTIDNAIQQAAQLMKDQLLNEIYPVRVAAILQNGQVVLDQPLAVGAQCELFSLGDKIKDSYTNSVLGYEETQVALLKVVRTNNKLSFAEVITGQADKGSICKVISEAQKVAQEYVTQTPQGGVKLPFD